MFSLFLIDFQGFDLNLFTFTAYTCVILFTLYFMTISAHQDQPAAEASAFIDVAGVLEILDNKSGVLLSPKRDFKRRPTDPYVPHELISRFKLRRGMYIEGQAQEEKRFPNPRVRYIKQVDGLSLDQRRRLPDFSQLLTIAPDHQLKLETPDGPLTTRVIDLFCPIGRGQRGLIVAPPRTGKTTLLHHIAQGILTNYPACHLMVLLVDERPEEVTDFRRSAPQAEVLASSNDEAVENHIRLADLAVDRAKAMVETGRHVVMLVDSITRLTRAFNVARGNSGKTMTGGLDSRALEKPRQLFSAARNTEDAGSLTIIATALIETGSRMDDLIFQEFKGTGNMELVLDRKVAELRLWPAINLAGSGTRKEELLLDADVLEKSHFLRRALANQKIEDAAESLIQRLSKTKDNASFLALLQR